MPETLGVQTLQDVCMKQFCLHLSELAITSGRILAAQTPRQEPPVHATEPEVENPRTPQDDAQQAASSDVPQDTERETEADEDEEAGRQDGADVAPVGEDQASEKAGERATECREPAVEQGGLIDSDQADCGQSSEDSGQKIGDGVEQQKEARTYLIRNVPPCFFEQLVHNTLTIINKHFYNPK